MNDSKDLMLGRMTKNFLFILLGVGIGVWSITKTPLSRTDYIIMAVAVFAFIWDIYLWYQVFIKYRKDEEKDKLNEGEKK